MVSMRVGSKAPPVLQLASSRPWLVGSLSGHRTVASRTAEPVTLVDHPRRVREDQHDSSWLLSRPCGDTLIADRCYEFFRVRASVTAHPSPWQSVWSACASADDYAS